jgi:polar amino acid transport system permease protein
MSRGTAALDYNWQWYRVFKYICFIEDGTFNVGLLTKGLLITFKISGISLVWAFIFGLAAAFFRLSNSLIARILARGYLELIRNTPLLVQIFFIYFVLSPVLDISRFTSAVLALSLFEGAYASEIFRAGIVSIPKGQWEAAGSLGLGTYYTYRHIILPQAIRWILPPLTGQAISLVKDSALVSTIAIYDLTMQGQAIVSETYMVFEIWFVIALIYLLITGSLSVGVNFMEQHLRVSNPL